MSWTHLLLAQSFVGLGDQVSATRAAGRAAALDPTSEAAQRLRATALLKSGCLPESLAAARDAVRLAPDGFRSHIALADAQLANGHIEEAEASAQRAVELAPANASALDVLGRVRLKQKRYGTAVDDFRRELGLDRRTPSP